MVFGKISTIAFMGLCISLAACQQDLQFKDVVAENNAGQSIDSPSNGSSGGEGTLQDQIGSGGSSGATGATGGTGGSGDGDGGDVVVVPSPTPTSSPSPTPTQTPPPVVVEPTPTPTPTVDQGVATVENFSQSVSETKKLDILWVIDNSGSMADEQAALGNNFNNFINDFITRNVDFKMSITTTDTSTTAKCGAAVAGADTKLTSAAAHNNQAQFLTDFKNLINQGTSGSGAEKGLAASECWVSKYGATFLRPDAYFAVVYVSDEQDQSAQSPSYYADKIKGIKASAGLTKAYSIVNKDLTPKSDMTVGFDRYAAVSDATAGTVADIQGSFYHTLGEMGQTIINLLDSFALANSPIPGSLKVFVNGVETQAYSFDAASRSIKFNAGSVPQAGSSIRVEYRK